MDLKDDSVMMGAFSGPGECNLSMVNPYHEHNLAHSLEPHSLGQSHLAMPVSSATTSLSSGLISQQQSHSSQLSNQSHTTATPVISLFKLKNFLYQPKFKNLLHSPEVPNGVSNGGSVEEHPQALQPSATSNQLYSGSVTSRHSMVQNNTSTNNSSVNQILGLSQPFKFSSHLQVSNGTTRKYQCKMCPQIFYSKADMQLHTQVHMREAKPYKCSQCSKSFANSSYLSQHTRIHLGIKPYRCEICQRKFTQLSHLQQHIRTHTGDKPYKCRYPNCTKAFSQLSNLQSHSRSHQTDKPFKCNSCYKCFTDEAGLLDHIPKHKESKHLKTHICQFCGKSYTQETYLAKHMQKHSDRMEKRPVLARPPVHLPENYWHKNQSNACQPSSLDCSNNLVQAQAQSEQQCLQPLSVEGHQLASTRFDQSGRLPMTGLGPINSRNSDELVYGLDKNGNSAFAPLQSSAVLSGANVRMSYFSYESFNFPNKPSSGMEGKKSMEITSKAGHASFPNQLIALNQIRNYASMPSSVSITTAEHPISLKD